MFSFINILGLALSMVACLLIFKYVSFEKSYDDYHSDAERVFRIYRHAQDIRNVDDDVASIFPGIAPLLKDGMPEFEKVARFIGSDKIFQSFAFTNFPKEGEPVTFNIPRAYFADDDALEIFHLEWVEGGTTPSLKNTHELVISESFAKRFFGEASALGKFLRFKNQSADFKITGVFKDQPANTHFKFDVLCSFASLPKEWNLDNDFGWGNFYTYAKVASTTELADLDERMTQFIGKRETWYAEEGISFKLQPVQSIHLTSHQSFEIEANGDQRTVAFLSVVGVFIMIIAWVNYINLSTSRLIDRAREVGIRKVLGGYKRQLIAQFLTESVLVNGLAILLSLTLLQASLGFFEQLLDIPIRFFDTAVLSQTLAFIGLFALGSVVFGFYPALLFSRLKIVSVLKGKSKASKSGLMLRRGLTLFQFVIALVLIIGALSVKNQVDFMQHQSLGFSTDQTLIIKKPFIDEEDRETSHSTFKAELKKLKGIQGVSASSEIPGYEITRMRGVSRDRTDEGPRVYAKDIAIDENFVGVFDMSLAYGQAYSKDMGTNVLMLNESAAKLLLKEGEGLEDLIGKMIYYDRGPETKIPVTLVGIVKDFRQQSLKQELEPQIYTFFDRIKFYSVKLNTSEISQTLTGIQSAFNSSFESSHFDYFFMDDYFNRQYQSDILFGKIFTFFSLFAIVITVLGLFGLSLYNIGQRSKEVSIRKVLGATVTNISLLLTREYMWLILISTIIAIPFAYLLLDNWLSNFDSRMAIRAWLFITPVLIVTALTLFTVGYQVLKTAYTNPSESLRYE